MCIRDSTERDRDRDRQTDRQTEKRFLSSRTSSSDFVIVRLWPLGNELERLGTIIRAFVNDCVVGLRGRCSGLGCLHAAGSLLVDG